MAFWDNIRFPYFNMQELNLDWIMKELKRIAGFMPQDGNVGDILTRKSDGAAWEPPEAVNININGLPEDTEIGENDQLIFYDISAQANRKIKPPNLLDSMMSNGTPLMDGTASPGTSKKPARYDHKHPTDTSRQAALTGAQMNAVNSGAPASSFSSGKLKIANGGTGADNAADARVNLCSGLSYTTNGLVTNNCTIVGGGYVICGNIVIVNFRANTTAAGAVISGFPTTAFTESGNILGGSAYDTANERSVDFYVNHDGVLTFPAAFGTGTFLVSFVYLRSTP